jgi:hypothetical protein
MADAPDTILARIQKLLNLADSPNENEASVAAAKAQELMDEWNLTTAEVERNSGQDGKREDARVRGGFYKWQRQLWRSVAELHFCMYWTQDVTEWKTVADRDWGGTREKRLKQKRHRLVGRVVNTTATQHMAFYLEEAVERAMVEAISGLQEWNNNLRYSNWAMSFRAGMADRLVERLAERRQQKLAEARQVDTTGASTSRALTIADVQQLEEDANNDFLYGEGWSAEQRAQRARFAEQRRLEREAHTRWASEHPEEAAEQERQRKEADERWWKTNGWRYNRGGGRRSDDSIDRSAYRAGSDVGSRISLDGQVGGGQAVRRIGR